MEVSHEPEWNKDLFGDSRGARPDGLDGASRMDTTGPESTTPQPSSDPVVELAKTRIAEGRQTFRFETFGDEAFWGGVLRIHEAIAGASHGGVGAGVSPTAALAVGLKVDAEALPSAVVGQIKWVQFPI